MRRVGVGLAVAVRAMLLGGLALGGLACGQESSPEDVRVDDGRCHVLDSRPDIEFGLRLTFCTDDNSQFYCYRLYPRPDECAAGEVVVGCYRPEDEARTLECGAPKHCMPLYLDNPPCCPTTVSEPIDCVL